MKDDIICWWSGGVTSAVACKLAIDIFGLYRCKIISLSLQIIKPSKIRIIK